MEITTKTLAIGTLVIGLSSFTAGYMTRKPETITLTTQSHTESHSVGSADKVTVTETKYVQVPGKAPVKDTVTKTVSVNPKVESRVEATIKEEITKSTNNIPKYRLGVACSPVDCVDVHKLSFTGSVQLGSSPFHLRATVQPKSMSTSVGLEVGF